MRKFNLNLIVAVLLLPDYILVLVLLYLLQPAYTLAHHFQSVQGRVVGMVMESTSSGSSQPAVVYTYAVGGKAYLKQGITYAPNPPAAALKPGDMVTVSDNPGDPGHSVCGDARAFLQSKMKIVWIIGAVVLAHVVYLALWAIPKLRERQLALRSA